MKTRRIVPALGLAVGVGLGCNGILGTPDPRLALCGGVTCSGHGACVDVAGAAACRCDGGYQRTDPVTCVASVSPALAGCPMLPNDHIFNTQIDTLPVDANSTAYLDTIGMSTRLHLDLGTQTNQQATDFYGSPYNIVNGTELTWTTVQFFSADQDVSWDARAESDCAVGPSHTVMSPCTSVSATLPIPASPLVEGGIDMDPSQQPYGDHHLLILDADTCRLWEAFHVYQSSGTWNIYGAATFDLRSNAMRPDRWTSADAAGFPILPLLLRADEATTGTIKHALRFTITSPKIRGAYIWPATHLANKGPTSTNLPPMGQLFRLKASYPIPSSYTTQAKAILQAMKTYGMYIADGGSDMYVTGEPSSNWQSDTLSQVQTVPVSQFEAVDITPIMSRPGFGMTSARVP